MIVNYFSCLYFALSGLGFCVTLTIIAFIQFHYQLQFKLVPILHVILNEVSLKVFYLGFICIAEWVLSSQHDPFPVPTIVFTLCGSGVLVLCKAISCRVSTASGQLWQSWFSHSVSLSGNQQSWCQLEDDRKMVWLILWFSTMGRSNT